MAKAITDAGGKIGAAGAGWFITGTDTGVGKTLAAQMLLLALRARGIPAVGMKPVASGCRSTPLGLRSEDAEVLLAASGVAAPYDDVNPYAFEPAIAPHLAGGEPIEIERIGVHYGRLRSLAPYIVVEGVGGWAVPIGPRESMADLAAALALPVILVVGLRLGCLNHALLTAQAIEARGLKLAGWVANPIDPAMLHVEANIASLRERLAVPLIARFPSLPPHGRYEELVSLFDLATLGLH
jgi:dethiobiotin synthetase